ncbi:AraC family transcriptional regulator [Salmonirosea aquatica]|uniref:Helix-turn-helix domain-containing protein n=1 Tax=Salmonirosea aquatica TaxID=2654236 RepID=A0A7C9FQ43_9BACT|nr:helix-turn-helix domain-containing protein [Cytophagaceae bacterium SJW1-29]
MKPLLLKVKEDSANSFDIRHEKVPYFDNPWHYHPEFELALVLKSSGLRFIGDSIEPFGAGDLVLLGTSLPHYWRNDALYYQNKSEVAEAIILRFRSGMWGEPFFEIPEMQRINELLQRAARGIHFPVRVAELVTPLLHRIIGSEGAKRLMGWMEVFTVLAEEPEFRLLSEKTFGGNRPIEDSGRIQTVLAYIQEHLTAELRLDEAADLANMNKAAFCRYFKQQTNKTFTEVVNELRIQLACRMLLDSSRDISQIGFQCGFQDVSYFNQVFKSRKGMSPSVFRKVHTG